MIPLLALEWFAGMGPSSDPAVLMDHPAYRRIVDLGAGAVIPILELIRTYQSLLVWALWDITGEDPVPRSAAGNLAAMCGAWLRWGADRGLIRP